MRNKMVTRHAKYMLVWCIAQTASLHSKLSNFKKYKKFGENVLGDSQWTKN